MSHFFPFPNDTGTLKTVTASSSCSINSYISS